MPDVVATLRTWRSVLTQPHVLSVFVTTGAGRLARASAPLAVVLVVAASTGSYAWAGAAAGVLTLADAATAPAKGRLADRYGRMLGLLPGVLGYAAALLALAVPPAAGRAWTLGCAAVAGACAPPISGSVKSLLLVLVRPDGGQLRAAYVLESSVQQLLFFAGPVYVAAVTAASSARVALGGAAVCTVAGVVAFVLLTREVAMGSEDTRPAGQQLRPRAGALAVPAVFVLTLVTLLQSIAFGANSVAVAATAGAAGVPSAAGFVLAFGPVGGLVGGLLIAPGGRRAAAKLVRMLLVAAACYTPMVLLPLPAIAVCLFAAGLVVTPLAATCYLLLSGAAPAGLRTEAFAWLSTAVATGSAIGSALAGQVADVAGARPALLIAGCAVLAAAAAGAARRGVLVSNRNE